MRVDCTAAAAAAAATGSGVAALRHGLPVASLSRHDDSSTELCIEISADDVVVMLPSAMT